MSSNDGKWHHICYAWSNSHGSLKAYKDGDLIFNDQNIEKNYTIKGGGSLVLGQDQDTFGSGFTKGDSFKGTLTGVNIWSYVVPPEKIKEMSKTCFLAEGDVYKRYDFKERIKGEAFLVTPSLCVAQQ